MKNKFKIITALVIGIVGTIGYVVADDVVSIINANQVGYSSTEKTEKTNVQGAIDELYDMVINHCPDGKICDTVPQVIYYNPTEKSYCDEKQYITNLASYSATYDPTGLDNGCMK